MEDTVSHVPKLFYLFALVAVGVFAWNARRLFAVRAGKEEAYRSVDLVEKITNALTFGVGQRAVMSRRFGYAAVMHFLLAWGFIELFFATTVDFFVERGWLLDFLPRKDTPWFAALNDLGGLMLLVGLGMALYRRYLNRPVPLPQEGFKGRGNFLGDTGILLLLIVLCVGGFLAEAARLGVENPGTAAWSWIGYPISRVASAGFWEASEPFWWWSHAIASLGFIAILPTTKMFHAIAVIANVALTDRENRTMVRPMNVSEIMEDEDVDFDEVTFGAKKADEFTWKQLLDSVSCTECARCTAVCPAYAVDRPLSPMKLITDIRADLYDRTVRGKDEVPDLVGGRIDPEELWSCTTCGACMNVCPVLIDHVPTFTDMRRHLVLSEGQPPQGAGGALEGMMTNGNPWGLAEDRMAWTEKAGVEVPMMADKKKAEVLYWVGCAGAFDARNQKIAQATARVLTKAGVDFAVLGHEESCTGDSARRIGEEYLYETLAKQNVETLQKYEFKTIVTPCPHCLYTLKNEYKQFGGDFDVRHHSQYIDSLVSTDRLLMKKNGKDRGKVTYHDPCYLGRYEGEYDAPRSLVTRAVGTGNKVEMDKSRESSFCCGAGGGNMWYEVESGGRVNLNRVDQALGTGANTIATGCSFCMIMMDDAVKVRGKDEEVAVLDVAELVDEQV